MNSDERNAKEVIKEARGLGFSAHDSSWRQLEKFVVAALDNRYRTGQSDAFERAAVKVVSEIESSTGPTGGWLHSPKALCAAIVQAIRSLATSSQQAKDEQ